MVNPTPHKKPEEPANIKDKLSETLGSFAKNEKIEGLYSYAKSNTMDTFAYVFLIVGLVLLFFQPLYGGAIIGIVAGVYFSDEIAWVIRNANSFIESQGVVRCLIIGGLVLAFFISAPTIFVFTAVTVGLKQLIAPQGGKK